MFGMMIDYRGWLWLKMPETDSPYSYVILGSPPQRVRLVRAWSS